MAMLWHAAFAILCAIGAHAFAPAPIQWGGFPANKFVLVPKALASGVPVPNKGMDTPQQLTISDQASSMSSNDIPFLANLDHTIAWGATGMCVEASGDKSGDEISINRCTGGPNQLWSVLPWDHGRKNVIKLKGSQLCIDVNAEGGWNGASVELRECNDKASSSWLFGEPVIRGGASQPAPSFRMRHATFGLMLVLGALSLSTWAWLWLKRAVRLSKDQRRAAMNADHGGVSMLTFEGGKPSIPATMAISPISHEDRENSTTKEEELQRREAELECSENPESAEEVVEPAVMILNIMKKKDNGKKHNEIMRLKNVDAYNDKINEATEQDKTIVIKFFAGYCRACKAMAPKFQRVADEWEDIEFYEVQLEANMALVKSLGIKTLPYVEFILGKHGKVHGQAVGPSRVPEVPKWLEANVGTERPVQMT